MLLRARVRYHRQPIRAVTPPHQTLIERISPEAFARRLAHCYQTDIHAVAEEPAALRLVAAAGRPAAATCPLGWCGLTIESRVTKS